VIFKKDDIVIYPQHGACKVKGIKKQDFFGKKEEYLILETIINEMTLRVPVARLDDVGVRPPVSADELEDLVAVLSKADPRVPSNWSRRFKNHQEKRPCKRETTVQMSCMPAPIYGRLPVE
jgi:CarD family transcriptional regulator